MNFIFIPVILVIGLSGLAAQVLLLRELLISFYGNELTVGVILANWIISEALGVLLVGKLVDRLKSKIHIFIILQLLFSLALPLSIYLSRVFKLLLGIPSGEGIGLFSIVGSSFLIILPVSFIHGGLFSSMAKIYSLQSRDPAGSVGKVYTWETAGTLLGGLLVTYALIPRLLSLEIAFLVGLVNLIVCLFFFKKINKPLQATTLALITFFALLHFSGGIEALHRDSLKKQWRQGEILDYRNSVYGNIAVTKQLEQYTFFYNGIPVITAPYPDKAFTEDFGHLPLLFHPQPKQVLVISAGAGGLIHEILSHPIDSVVYVEIDPLIIKMLKVHPTALTDSELYDPRVRVVIQDARFFLRTYPRKYDVISIGISNPSDLSTNRLFTREFFALAKTRLKTGGILAFWLPGSLTYLSGELKNLNACISNSAKDVFLDVRVIPGDYNIYLASDSANVLTAPSRLISERITERNIKTELLLPSYLDFRLGASWLDWFKKSSVGSTQGVNRDLKPVAVFTMLKYWNEKFSPGAIPVLNFFERLKLYRILLFVILVTCLLFYRVKRHPGQHLALTYSIATTGFFGMLINLILIFSFQIFYGYLYQWIGILVSAFMAGIALGSSAMTMKMRTTENGLRLFMKLEAATILSSLLIGQVILRGAQNLLGMPSIFVILLLLTGFLLGAEFPLAGKIYLEKKQEVGSATGILYGADLLGGWFAGMLGGIVFLPVLGVWNTCLVIVIFKLSSLLLLIFTRPKSL